MIKEQNYTTDKTFTIEKQAQKGPIHTFYNYRMTQLKSKVTFYQGQLDPLHQDNAFLRDHLSSLSRLVSNSTDILRKLLPTSNNPNKRLKMDLANIEEIAAMIDEDWKEMERQLNNRNITINELYNQIEALTNKFKLELTQSKQQYDNLQTIKNQTEKNLLIKIEELSNKIKFVQCSLNRKIDQLRVTVVQKEQRIQQLMKSNQIQKYESLKKYDIYERRINQYKRQVDQKFKQIQEAKATVRAICDKVMVEKLAQQAEVYQYMLKTKEQQKMAIALSKEESEETLKRIIATKEGEYKKLSLLNQQHKLQIEQLNDKVYDTTQRLLEQKKNIKQLQNQIIKANQANTSLRKNIQIRQQQYKNELKCLSQINTNQQLQIKKIKEDNLINMIKKEQQKQQMERKLKQKEQILAEMIKNQQEGHKRWKQQLQLLKQSIIEKEKNLNSIIQRKNKQIESVNQRINMLNIEHQNNILEIKMKNQGVMRQMQWKFKKETDSLLKQHQITLKRLEQLKQQQLIKFKYEFQNKINSIKQQHNHEMSRMNSQFNKKFEDQTKKFENQKKQLNHQIVQLKASQNLIKEKLIKAQKKILDHQREIQEINAQNYKKLKRIEQKNQEQKRLLNQRIQQQLADFQKQMQNQINQMCNMKAKMQDEINSLKQVKGVAKMQEKCSNEVNQMKLKFTEDMKTLAVQYEKKNQALIEKYQKDIKNLSQQMEKNIRLIQHHHQQQIQALKKDARKELVVIIEQIENKSTYLNDRCLFGIQSSDLMNVQNEILIKYLKEGINKYKQQIQKRNDIIAQLQQNILKKQRELEQYEKKIEEKVKHKKEEYQIFRRQLQNKMDEVQQRCKVELNKASKQKIQYTQKLFQQFQKIKEQQQNRYQKLSKKYYELQKLFQQRPSRSEDVTKIKQLINLQQKMDVKMQTYQKKVQTANEIVRYLNLQLENYKETFDIFGPATQQSNQNSPSVSPNKTISHQEYFDTESQKMTKYNKLQKIKDEYKSLIKQASIPFKQSQSPLIRQLKIFGDPDLNDSFVFQKQQSDERQRKLSFVSDLNGAKKQKIRTQKTQDITKGGEIIAYTQSFMKIIKNTEKQGYITLHQVQKRDSQQKKKTYRRRKLSKRVTTHGVQHFL